MSGSLMPGAGGYFGVDLVPPEDSLMAGAGGYLGPVWLGAGNVPLPIPVQPSRTSGLLPLGVFFRPDDAWTFAEIEETRFVWSVNGVETFVGFNFIHVFDTEGVHDVTVEAFQDGESIGTQSIVITVDAWAGTEFYVSATGNDADPGTQAEPFLTVDHGMTQLFASPGPRRLLFKRGDSFSTTTTFNPPQGPYRIGDYGAGAKPVITTEEQWIESVINRNDIAVYNLDITGPGTYDPGSGNTTLLLRGSNTVVYQCDMDACPTAIGLGALAADGCFIAGCNVTNSVNYGTALMGTHIGAINSTIDDVTIEHLCRMLYFNHALFADNTTSNGAANKHHLKAHGDVAAVVESQRLLVSSNSCPVPGSSSWLYSIGPEDNGSPEKSRECIVERNALIGDASPHAGVQSRGCDDMVIRNNTFFNIEIPILASSGVAAFSTWAGWRMYYNSSYYSGASEYIFSSFETAAAATALEWHNNITRSPAGNNSSRAINLEATIPLSEVTDTNNFWNMPFANIVQATGIGFTLVTWQAAGKGASDSTADPLYTNGAAGDLTLQAGSAARNAAVALSGGFEDILENLRPFSGTTPDIGAYES